MPDMNEEENFTLRPEHPKVKFDTIEAEQLKLFRGLNVDPRQRDFIEEADDQ